MEHSIRIDDEVFGHLQRLASPFVDTPNTVLRRVLHLNAETEPQDENVDGAELPVVMGARTEPRRVTPQRLFRPFILTILMEAGGGRSMHEVLDAVETRMGPQFVSGDHDPVSTGEVRWRNAARWERMAMVKDGLMATGSPSGFWELTEEGKRSARDTDSSE